MKNLMKKLMKIEIGPGKKRLSPDWITLGSNLRDDIDYHYTWGDGPTHFEAETVDLIYTNHVLEHIAWHKTEIALREAYRILKIGGILEIWVPDFEQIVHGYLRRECLDNLRHFNPEGDFMKWVNAKIFRHGEEGERHFCVFDQSSLRRILKKVGFKTFLLDSPRGNNHGTNLGVGGEK